MLQKLFVPVTTTAVLASFAIMACNAEVKVGKQDPATPPPPPTPPRWVACSRSITCCNTPSESTARRGRRAGAGSRPPTRKKQNAPKGKTL